MTTNEAFADLMDLESADVEVMGKTFTLTSLVPADVQKASKMATNKKGKLDDAKFKNTMLAMSLAKVHGKVDAKMFETMPVKNLSALMLKMNEVNGFDVLMKEALKEMQDDIGEDEDSEDE